MPRFNFVIIAIATLFTPAAVANAENLDFTGLTVGSSVTSQYPGVVFSLQGGPESTGSPTIGNFNAEGVIGLANSNSGNYPTADVLDIAFTAPVSGVSFNYDNLGAGNGAYFTAYDGTTVVDSGSLDVDGNSYEFASFTLAGSEITDLQLNNNAGNGDWEFEVGSLAFTPETAETPEPGSFLLLGTGIAGMAGLLRRKFLAR